MLYDLAVIGGGAAGIAAAISASRVGDRVVIVESGSELGKKIQASGNGRCNLLNTGSPRYYGDTEFACHVIRLCGPKEQIRFWHSIGLLTAGENENRVYPCTFQSSTVLNILKNALKLLGTEIILNSPVTDCRQDHALFFLSSGNASLSARRVLIATGGPAGRKSSSTDSGYEILRRFGHRIMPLRPSLVPLVTDKRSISGLSGIRVRCTVSVLNRSNCVIHQEKGEVLFTDYGVSGICAMQCARFIDGDGCCLELDLVSSLFTDDRTLSDELLFRKRTFGSLSPDTLLIGMLNARLSYAVMKQSGIPIKGETLNDLEDSILEDVARTLRHYRISVIGTRQMTDAQVTAGGAECREFNPGNMESRLVPGLHAAGEILNTDGDCGGFNLMFAFGSGILAGLNNRKPSEIFGNEGREAL